MSATRTRHRRGHEEEHEEHENEERWLVSFADMMTLMFALFMVLFSISSVNTSKFESLKKSLEESFNAKLLSGGEKLMETGGTQETERSSPEPPLPSMMPADAVSASFDASKAKDRADAAAAEQEAFKKLKRRIDAEAAQLGLADKVRTSLRPRGLVIRLLTDGVLFASGQAELAPRADSILTPLGKLIRSEGSHPVVVEGYTDDVPIRSSQFPTNWELSGARASRVVRHFITDGVPIERLSAMQFAQQHPIASNASEQGRSRNRRVEVVLTRLNPTSTQGGETP
jgi:chemotaxis protein MotB